MVERPITANGQRRSAPARRRVVAAVAAVLIAGCGGPVPSSTQSAASGARPDRSDGAGSPAPTAEGDPSFAVQPIAGAPEIVFFTAPEPGRMVLVAERPGVPPRQLGDIALEVTGEPGLLVASAAPDGGSIAVAIADGAAPPDLLLVTMSGEELWRADDQFGNFIWSADASALSVDRIDGTGLLLELGAAAGEPAAQEVAYAPPSQPAEPSPRVRDLHQPIGFSRDGRTLYSYRLDPSGAPYFEIASKIDRADGTVSATGRIGAGDDALARSNTTMVSPQQVRRDGAIAFFDPEDDEATLRVRAPGSADVLVPLPEIHPGSPVWDGDRLIVPNIVFEDPDVPMEQMRFTLELLVVDPEQGEVRPAVEIAAGSSLPTVVDCRDGFVLVRLQPVNFEDAATYVLIRLDDGTVSGFTSAGAPVGWITSP